jgi:hypothetical protein
MKRRIPIAIMTVACIVAVVVVARLSTRTSEPTSQARTSSEATEPRGGDEAREEAEELGQELRLEGGVARVSQVANAPAAGWQGEQVWSLTANDWEPAIAVDPSSTWVYEATTR